MKKLILLAAAAATVFAPGCVKTNNGDAPEGARLVVKIEGAAASSETRSVEASASPTGTDVAPSLNKAYVYVIYGEEVYGEEMDVTAAQDGGYVIGNGKGPDGLQMYFPTSSQVYVLGNWPTGIAPATLTSWEEIEAAVSAISYTASVNTNYKIPAMANAGGVPLTLSNVDEAAHTAEVTVEISPLYSRMELKAIKGGPHMVSYDVTGVWVNNYFNGFTMAGKGVRVTSTGSENTPYVHASGSTDFSNVFGDTSTTGWSAVGDPGAMTATAGTDRVWAYHVGAGSVATLIVRLDKIKYYLDDGDGNPDVDRGVMEKANPHYLVMSGYSNLTSGEFERGYIYQIDALEFDIEDIGEKPVVGVAITAKVKVNNWKVSALSPEI